MCCDISPDDVSQNNRSCCFGNQAINQFSIGSRVGTVSLIPLSTSQPPSTTVSISSIPVASFSSSASHSTTSLSSTTAASLVPLGLGSADHSKINGSTIGIAVGTSVGTVMLIIACFLTYQYRRRRRVKAKVEANPIMNLPNREDLPHQEEYELAMPIRELLTELPD